MLVKNVENFVIIKKCKSDRETNIYEAIFVKQELPKLNVNLFTDLVLCTPWRVDVNPGRLRSNERVGSCLSQCGS